MRQTAKRKSFNLLNEILKERNLPVLTEEDYIRLTRDDILDRIEELEEPEQYQQHRQYQQKAGHAIQKRSPSTEEIGAIVDGVYNLAKVVVPLFFR